MNQTKGEPIQTAERRLASWQAALSASSNPTRLEQRLRYLGWSMEEATMRLSGESAELFERSADPEAARLLEAALTRLESDPPHPPLPEIPFAEIFTPFVEVAVAELHATLPADLATGLAKELGHLAAPSLLAAFRQQNALLRLPPQSEPYQKLVADLRAGGLRQRLADLPVLASNLGCHLLYWREAMEEFIGRLEADREALGSTFPGASGEVIAVDRNLGDSHRGGRRVTAVTFADGRKLIYKPRSLQMDVAWHGLVEWLRERDPSSRLRAPRALDGGDYGWVEFVEPGVPEDPRDYYRSAGKLLALAWLCGGSDFHEENVIATSFGPVLIDLETLFTPTARPFGFTDQDLAEGHQEQTFGTNILSTFLLPVWQVNEGGQARDLGGFSGRRRERADWCEPKWVDLGTDRMREEMCPAPGRQPLNIPRGKDGALIHPEAFADEMVDGFIQAARTLCGLRDELPLEGFRGANIRFLVRNTQVYGVMLNRVKHPKFLGAFADRSIELEKLARPFFPPQADAPRPEVFNCYEAERIGLEHGDIPCFHAQNDEQDLHGDGGIVVRNYFWKTGWDIAQQKLQQSDDSLIAEQASLLRASLGLRYRVEPPASREEPAPKENGGNRWTEAALAIAADIAPRAIPLSVGGVSWLALGFDPVRKLQTPALMGLDLYSGSLGVAVFLAALAQTTGDEQWMRLAKDCTRPRLDLMRAPSKRPFLARMSLGIGSGLGSLIYGCQLLGDLLGDERYYDDAQFFAEIIGGDGVDRGDVRDILGGEAGAVIALLNLHEATGHPALLETAVRFGHSILEGRSKAPTGHRVWKPEFADQALTGLGHGAAGFALALERLASATGVTAFSDAAAEAIAYETTVFDFGVWNWPDYRRGAAKPGTKPFMHGWCAGQPGIGLGRLRLGPNDSQAYESDLDAAVADAMHGPELGACHLCCGEAARVEFLIEIDRRRPEQGFRQGAELRAERILAKHLARGYFPLTGAEHGRLFAPSFFQGISGIGYTLLRLANASLPAVSMLETLKRS